MSLATEYFIRIAYPENKGQMVRDVMGSPRRFSCRHLNHCTTNAPHITTTAVALSPQHLQEYVIFKSEICTK